MMDERHWAEADRQPEAGDLDAVKVLVAHQRRDIGSCICGWGVDTGDVGRSHALHVWRELQRALTAAGWRPPHQPRETFEDFWADLVTTGGQLDETKVRAELHDYYLVMGEVAKVYAELTDGRISKPNTLAGWVVSEANLAAERAFRADGWVQPDSGG